MRAGILFMVLVVSLHVYGCLAGPVSSISCPDNVSVTVQMAKQPIFSWDPVCGAEGLLVQSTATIPYSFMWRIDNTADEGLIPPVTYGVNPYEGIFIDSPSASLEEGNGYIVKVLMGGGHLSIGELEFIYTP